MTLLKPTPAGFIVYHRLTASSIDGYGRTKDEAWRDFLAELALNKTWTLSTKQKKLLPYAMEEDYVVAPASQALLDQLEAEGGSIQWSRVGETRCTVAEFDAFCESEDREDDE